MRLSKLIWGVGLTLLPVGQLLAGTGPTIGLSNPLDNTKYGNLNAFLSGILDIVIQYGALLIVFFIVFAGFKFVTAQGNTEKIADARKMLVWIIVGAFVLLGTYVIKAAICGTLVNIGVTGACGA